MIRRRGTIAYRMVFVLFCMFAPVITAHAGSINANEQSVISAASGTFTYNGKTYRAYDEYIAALRDYLSEDDVDLSAEQASSAISQMYASVQEGIDSGYIYEVGGDTQTDTETREDGGSSVKNDEKQTGEGSSAKNNEKQTNSDFGGSDDYARGGSLDEEADASGYGQGTTRASKSGGQYSDIIDDLFEKSKDLSQEETKEAFARLGIILAAIFAVAVIIYGVQILIRKKKAAPLIAACLDKGLTEMHCHILPGVDDGAKDMETSMAMVETGYADGIRKIVATPHYIENHLKYDEEKLQKIFEEFKEKVNQIHPDITCYLGNELYYYGEQSLERVKEGRVHGLAGSKYILIEFSTKISYHDMYKAMKGFVQARYYPVLAHMERFQCLTKHPERVDELSELGVYFQMNADSVLGKGADKAWCRRMLKENRIQLLGTDAHGTTHRTMAMRKAVFWLYEHLEPDYVEDLLIRNPQMLLDNKRID